MPRSPVPRVGIRAAGAVVARPRRAAIVAGCRSVIHARWRRPMLDRRWSAPRRRRSTRPTRPAPAAAGRARRRPRPASARPAPAPAPRRRGRGRPAPAGGCRAPGRAARTAPSLPAARASASSARAPSGSRSSSVLGQRQAHAERDQPGLGAVVQVALDAAQLGRLGVDGLGARLGQLLHAQGQPALLGRPSSARSICACARSDQARRQPPEQQVEHRLDDADDRQRQADRAVDEASRAASRQRGRVADQGGDPQSSRLPVGGAQVGRADLAPSKPPTKRR